VTGAPRLSVVVPAVDEATRIAGTVAELRSALEPVAADGVELVVVDDGSTDGTEAAARAAGADLVLRHERNRGKGAAVRTGVAATTGRCVAYTDVDLAYPPAQLLGLLAEVESGAQVVLGNRRDPASTTVVKASTLRDLGGRAINLLTRSVLSGGWADTQGGLKAFEGPAGRSLLAASRVDGFAFDVEVLAIAEQRGLRIVEVPVTVSHSGTSTVRVAADAARLVGDLVAIRRRLRTGAYEQPSATATSPRLSGGEREPRLSGGEREQEAPAPAE
jgi:dolichyl-phosphate beta-glucosyltransferase